jgi:hypothetical protein
VLVLASWRCMRIDMKDGFGHVIMALLGRPRV